MFNKPDSVPCNYGDTALKKASNRYCVGSKVPWLDNTTGFDRRHLTIVA